MSEDAGPMHNFPRLIDPEVIAAGAKRASGSYIEFTLEGTWKFGGKVYEGVIEIGGEMIGKVFNITHRFFRPS